MGAVLRISISSAPEGTRLMLEGQLIGPWVGELEQACSPLLNQGFPLVLDLAAVSFVGREGADLLWKLRDRRVTLRNCSRFVDEQLKARAMDTEGERELIDRLRAHDASALEALMSLHASRLYRVAYGITRCDADAEEVVQDVFLTLFRKIDGFEGRAALGSWLYRVTTNAALIKRRGKRAELEVSLEEQRPTFLADGHREGDRSFLLADWSETPEETLLNGEARKVLERALDRLPDHYRAVVVLREVEGLANEEVAQILGESVPTVKSRLHRARMALREELTRALGPQLGA